MSIRLQAIIELSTNVSRLALSAFTLYWRNFE